MTEDAFYAAATLFAVAAVDQLPRTEVGTLTCCAAERGRSRTPFHPRFQPAAHGAGSSDSRYPSQRHRGTSRKACSDTTADPGHSSSGGMALEKLKE